MMSPAELEERLQKTKYRQLKGRVRAIVERVGAERFLSMNDGDVMKVWSELSPNSPKGAGQGTFDAVHAAKAILKGVDASEREAEQMRSACYEAAEEAVMSKVYDLKTMVDALTWLGQVDSSDTLAEIVRAYGKFAAKTEVPHA